MTSEMKWIAWAVAIGAVVFAIGLFINRIQGPRESYAAPTSPRRSPFRVGRSYRVLQTFQAMRDAFTAGEILVYRSEGYSIYDGAAGYFFEAPNDSRTRTWDVRDDEDLAAWTAFFEEVSAAPGPGSATRARTG